ncbi:hypothetical protein RhiirA5_441107 [Rhizophagus irregularis]|uniref:Uncharacterized protein n=1 Tax=Rhizophagus irregularis TaxID=588596 RepID=A0A2N0NFY5_9GLOM|nr:hypothetical protein RhiirA5_441107 [Rhizophagus irregularis]
MKIIHSSDIKRDDTFPYKEINNEINVSKFNRDSNKTDETVIRRLNFSIIVSYASYVKVDIIN